MRLHEFLKEGVNDNFLYHSVGTGQTIMKILTSGEIRPSISSNELDFGITTTPSISASRSQSHRYPRGAAVAQFVLDKKSLLNAGFAVKPFNDPMVKHKSEFEERITSTDNKSIPVKPPFVIELQIDSNLEIPQEIKELCKSAGIKITPMKSFNYQVRDKANKDASDRKKSKSLEVLSDPNNLKLTSQKFMDGEKYTLTYMLDNSRSMILHPYVQMPDLDKANGIFNKIKNRLRNNEPITDLFPDDKIEKSWDRGEYVVPPGKK